jgi:TPR repeat protein
MTKKLPICLIPMLAFGFIACKKEAKVSQPPAIGELRRSLSVAEQLKRIRANAKQGNPVAQFNLGARYANGDGVTQDQVQAYMWLTLSIENTTDRYVMPQAARSGMAPPRAAINLRESVAKEMTPADIEKAKKRAQVCLKSNYKRCD